MVFWEQFIRPDIQIRFLLPQRRSSHEGKAEPRQTFGGRWRRPAVDGPTRQGLGNSPCLVFTDSATSHPQSHSLSAGWCCPGALEKVVPSYPSCHPKQIVGNCRNRLTNSAPKKFSNRWKTAENFFQSLEKPARIFQPLEKYFPIIGKNAASFPTIGNFFSNHWKTRFLPMSQQIVQTPRGGGACKGIAAYNAV